MCNHHTDIAIRGQAKFAEIGKQRLDEAEDILRAMQGEITTLQSKNAALEKEIASLRDPSVSNVTSPPALSLSSSFERKKAVFQASLVIDSSHGIEWDVSLRSRRSLTRRTRTM